MLANGSWGEAELSEGSSANDVAILKLRVQTPEFLSLAPPRAAQVGQRVFTIGYPAVSLLGMEPKFSEGTISALSGPGGERTFIQVTVPIQPGSSGGPLVNESGQVLGLMTSTAAVLPFVHITGSLPQNVNWAINADFARPLIESRGRVQTRTREEAIQQTLRALCLVEAKS
jgi:S1-C subfamily serine protease